MTSQTTKHKIPIREDKISAVHHESNADKWIFLCHGFGGNKDRGNKERAEFFSKNGWNAVRIDFRGNGESTGTFKEQNLTSRIEDLKAVVDYFQPSEFLLFGTSFGGKVVLHSIEEFENVKGVIGKAPVTYNSIMDPFRSAVEEKGEFEYIENKPIDKRFFDDLDKHKFSNLAENINVPLCIFHGRDDTTVHIKNSFKAVETIETDCELHCLKEEKHSFSEKAGEKLQQKMLTWSEHIL